MEEKQEQLASGAYYVDKNGKHNLLESGTYFVDENGDLNQGTPSTISWQSAIDNIKWDEVHKLVENWGQRGTKERTISVLGIYALVGIIIVTASYLALKGIVEGQALVGFLGAAIGYILSRGEIGLK